MPRGKNQLTNQGQYPPMRVSPEDKDLADAQYSVKVVANSIRLYALTSLLGPQQPVHRIVASRMLGRELLSSEHVDHIDGDGLNNTRPNLRICTNAQNLMNRGPNSNNTSGYKGVTWHKANKKWRAEIRVGGKLLHIGMFMTPEDAARAYNEAAIKHHGTFAKLNVIV